MKFSVLLPTRNRLEYLRYAVETVRRQDYDDWELIISDNFSEEDIAGYIESLGDTRIKYFRTESFVPVTDNWNNALEKSTGDYVVMLGDDDCLMKGYFSTIRRLADEFDYPDFIYTSAFLFCYPGVITEHPDGYLQPYGYASFLNTAEAVEPYLLAREQAHKVVRQFMDFRVTYGFNMQFTVIRREFIKSLRDKGPFFQSPFPDYYATNVMFLKAERILICPYPLVTIGVTKKSYGFYHNNKREAEGVEFLQGSAATAARRSAEALQRVVLPGTNINTSWLYAAEAIAANYGAEFGVKASRRRYRFLQIMYVYEEVFVHRSLSREDLRELKEQMRLWERVVYGTGISAMLMLKSLLSPANRSKLYRLLRSTRKQFSTWQAEPVKSRYQNILDVFEQVNPFAGSEREMGGGVAAG